MFDSVDKMARIEREIAKMVVAFANGRGRIEIDTQEKRNEC